MEKSLLFHFRRIGVEFIILVFMLFLVSLGQQQGL